MAERNISESVLRASPDVVGRPLASPSRRILAFGVDFALLLIPSLVLAVAVAAFSLRWTDPGALQSIRTAFAGRSADPEVAARQMGPLAPLLVRIQAPGLPPTVAVAVEEGDLERAGEILVGYSLLFNLAFWDSSGSPRPGVIRVDLERLIPRLLRAAALFGLAALYFTLLTARKRSATLGKRLLGIEVMRLDGEPLSIWLSFERFAGYAVSLGTLGFGLLDFWRDPNRRLAHDRLSHTVVVRRRHETG